MQQEIIQLYKKDIAKYDGEKGSEDGKMHLLADLRRTFLKMEETENAHEWETLETELREEFDRSSQPSRSHPFSDVFRYFPLFCPYR